MAGELRFQILGADKFDDSVAPIAQRSAELAVVIGSWRHSVSGPIHEHADAGHAVADVVEVDLDREIGLGTVLGVVRQL
jgi:hypothetical protein